MTNHHNNIALESELIELKKKVEQHEKLLCRLLYKKKPKPIKKEAVIKMKISDLIRKNIDRNNSLVAKRIKKNKQ